MLRAARDSYLKDIQKSVNRLIKEGRDENGCTALHWAAIEGYEKIVELLLDHNININTKDFFGKTAIQYAIEKEHLSIIKILTHRGACTFKDGQDLIVNFSEIRDSRDCLLGLAPHSSR